jgi:hypothetical protein
MRNYVFIKVRAKPRPEMSLVRRVQNARMVKAENTS